MSDQTSYKELASRLYWERIERARRIPPEERMAAGAGLFDYAREITMAGLRHQYPDADQAHLMALFRKRLVLQRKLENRK